MGARGLETCGGGGGKGVLDCSAGTKRGLVFSDSSRALNDCKRSATRSGHDRFEPMRAN